MYVEGEIIVRISEPYDKYNFEEISFDVDVGTTGVVLSRHAYGGSQVLILDGRCKGEIHSWADSYTELEKNIIKWEV